MFNSFFGIEIEFTGITRRRAAEAAKEILGGQINGSDNLVAADGRTWKFTYDGSIRCQKKQNRQIVPADSSYSVELVSPKLKYREDIEALQEVVRRIRKAGGFANETCGIHLHLDGSEHTARSVRNFVNIIASRNDLFYKALQIEPERMRYCKKMDARLVERMNQRKPKTLDAIRKIWYEGYTEAQSRHYHNSRYHFCNLHSLFNGAGTIELRGFNSELHAGKIRSYIVLALALNNQALTQKSATSKKPQVENEKFAMRIYLNRIGFIGEEFKNCREHLCKHLEGNAAWRFRTTTVAAAA